MHAVSKLVAYPSAILAVLAFTGLAVARSIERGTFDTYKALPNGENGLELIESVIAAYGWATSLGWVALVAFALYALALFAGRMSKSKVA